MLHPDARISATMQVKIQSHPGERWTVSCCALNKRDGRSLTYDPHSRSPKGSGHPTPLTILGGLRLELLSGKGLEPALLEGIGLKDETVFCHHGVVLRKTPMQTRTVP